MYLALRLRSLCSRSAKIAMHISQIGIISAGLVRPWPRQVSRAPLRGTSAVTYHTNEGTYSRFATPATQLQLTRLLQQTRRALSVRGAWVRAGEVRHASQQRMGTNNAIVWVTGMQGDQRLHGYNADTDAVVYSDGGATS